MGRHDRYGDLLDDEPLGLAPGDAADAALAAMSADELAEVDAEAEAWLGPAPRSHHALRCRRHAVMWRRWHRGAGSGAGRKFAADPPETAPEIGNTSPAAPVTRPPSTSTTTPRGERA